jgi:hypothetical protein
VDARHKAGHDAEGVAQTRVIARILCGAGYALSI